MLFLLKLFDSWLLFFFARIPLHFSHVLSVKNLVSATQTLVAPLYPFPHPSFFFFFAPFNYSLNSSYFKRYKK